MPSRSVRGSKSHSVLVKSTWKKSSSDPYRQDHLPPSIDSPFLCLPNEHLPDLRPKAKHFAAYHNLFPATRTQAHGAAGRLVDGIDKDNCANQIERRITRSGTRASRTRVEITVIDHNQP